MKQYNYPKRKQWAKISRRPAADHSSLEKSVRAILQKVKDKGDKAIRSYTKQFDGVDIKQLKVSHEEIDAAASLLSVELKQAINLAKKNIETFHAAQEQTMASAQVMPGIQCWRMTRAIEKVGLYIPGGSAPLFSTVLMLGVPAILASCKQIILCTPPQKDGSIHPAILYTAQRCGITEIYKTGGAQAIAAMAYGTATIPKVNKLFGPGNQYVTIAKQLVQQEGIAIDMPAGPSELLIIADHTAVPEFVAADLLSQAEHGIDSQVILVTTESVFANKVIAAIHEQLKKLPRRKIATKALTNSKLLLVNDIDEAVEFSNVYAPEHLLICCEVAEKILMNIQSAGSVFIGNYSPESAGDYASGTNHVLPTNGYAATYSGVSLDSFTKKITCQQLTKEGLQSIGNAVMLMAEAEGLMAHKNAVVIRLNQAP